MENNPTKAPDYRHGTFVIGTTSTNGLSYEEFTEEWKDRHNCPDIPNKASEEYRRWKEENGRDDYDEFLEEWKDAEGYENVPSDDSKEYYDWMYRVTQENWENDLENIDEEKAYNVPVVLTGSLGLWDGNHSIVAEMFDSVGDAIRKIINNGSGSTCCDFDIEYVDGHIKMLHHHHDGTNSFMIRALSRKGIAKCRAAENRYEDIPELKPHDFRRLKYLYA